MRLSRIYCSQHLATGVELRLEDDTLHYLRNVLRLQKDQQLLLFNEQDGEFTALITAVNKQEMIVSVQEKQRDAIAAALEISLGLALSRGERMDYGIQKSTELGVHAITPLACEFCEARVKPERLDNRMRHWQKLVAAAAEQSNRMDLPLIEEPKLFEEWITQRDGAPNLLFHPGGTDELPARLEGKRVRVTIGPEGGFSDGEVALARSNGVLVCALGPRVLRTETAPVVALAVLQHRYGDLG